jgi:hypothetical protein
MTDHRRVHDHAEPWDRTDVVALETLRSDGLTMRECALRLGRTLAAVRSKLYRLRRTQ